MWSRNDPPNGMLNLPRMTNPVKILLAKPVDPLGSLAFAMTSAHAQPASPFVKPSPSPTSIDLDRIIYL